jgi:hypothetical protein
MNEVFDLTEMDAHLAEESRQLSVTLFVFMLRSTVHAAKCRVAGVAEHEEDTARAVNEVLKLADRLIGPITAGDRDKIIEAVSR